MTDKTVWEVFEEERQSLMTYRGAFDGFHAMPTKVSPTLLVRFDNNYYSVERNRYDVLKNVYSAASKAVHGVGMKNGATGLLVQGQDICREGIMKRIRSKQQPDWLEIVFGR